MDATFIQEKLLTFNPGLALTSFQTTQPWRVMVKRGANIGIGNLSVSETCLGGYCLKANSGLRGWTELENLNQPNNSLSKYTTRCSQVD